MSRTPVTIRHDADQQRIEAVLEDGTVAGFSEYHRRGESSTYSFTHTEVDDAFEGQGVGGQLARGVMDFARENDVKILPSCTFIRAYMREHEETHDLLAKGARLEPDPEEAVS